MFVENSLNLYFGSGTLRFWRKCGRWDLRSFLLVKCHGPSQKFNSHRERLWSNPTGPINFGLFYFLVHLSPFSNFGTEPAAHRYRNIESDFSSILIRYPTGPYILQHNGKSRVNQCNENAVECYLQKNVNERYKQITAFIVVI